LVRTVKLEQLINSYEDIRKKPIIPSARKRFSAGNRGRVFGILLSQSF
jgi:hypothetical protein